MMKVVIIVFSFFFIISLFSFAQAQIDTTFPKSLEETALEGNFITTKGDVSSSGIEKTIGGAIAFLLSFTSLVFFFWLFYGAYEWLLARGNEEKIDKAQGIIRSAIWGIVIITLSYFILSLIMGLLVMGDKSIWYPV